MKATDLYVLCRAVERHFDLPMASRGSYSQALLNYMNVGDVCQYNHEYVTMLLQLHV
jgi:hypothetical protein